MFRKQFLIIAFILVVIAIAAMIYFVFFKDVISPLANNTNGGTNGTLPGTNNAATNRVTVNDILANLPVINASTNALSTSVNAVPDTIARGGVTTVLSVTETSAVSAAIASDGSSVVYYDPITKKFYRVSKDGKSRIELSSQIFPDVTNIVWSPSKDSAIITFPDQSKILFNFSNGTQATLPKEWDDITFSPQGNQVAYKFITTDVNNRWLAVSQPDGSESVGVEPLGDNDEDVQVAWSPDNQIVGLFHKSSSDTQEEVIPIGFHGENFKSFAVEGRGFESKWSPTGDKLLYTTYNSETNYNPTLTLVNVQGDQVGQQRQSLGIQTWVDKCTFASSGSILYCAVPQTPPEGSGIYPELATSTPDVFWRVDLATGLRTPLAVPVDENGNSQFSAQNIFLSTGEDFLYFTDATSGRILRVQLK